MEAGTTLRKTCGGQDEDEKNHKGNVKGIVGNVF